MSIPLSVDEWQRQRAIYVDPSSTPEELGFATFYLNRTNRSGIISGGIIGGIRQTGAWKIGARFNRKALCDRIGRVAEFGSRITVTMKDALQIIESTQNEEGQRLLYLDPPYYVKGEGLYDNFYGHDDHVKVSQAIRRTSGPWIVSYDAAPEILKLYDGCDSLRYTLGYSASKSTQGTEVMFFSPGITMPKVESPAGISIDVVARAKKNSEMLF